MPDDSMGYLTNDAISEKLDDLAPVLRPLGAMSRIIACIGLWQPLDSIRSAEGPFDRSRFGHYIEQLKSWSERNNDGGALNSAPAADSRSVEDYYGQSLRPVLGRI